MNGLSNWFNLAGDVHSLRERVSKVFSSTFHASSLAGVESARLPIRFECVPVRSVTKTAGAVLLFLVTVGAQNQPTRVSGNPTTGKALFEGSGQCLTCHSIESRGRK